MTYTNTRRLLGAALLCVLATGLSAQNTTSCGIEIRPAAAAEAGDLAAGLYLTPDGAAFLQVVGDKAVWPALDDYRLQWYAMSPGSAPDERPSYLWDGLISSGNTFFLGGEGKQEIAQLSAGVSYDFFFAVQCGGGDVLAGPVTLAATEPIPCNYDFTAEATVAGETSVAVALAVDQDNERNSIGHDYNIEVGPPGFAPGTGEAVRAATGQLLLSQTVTVDGLEAGTDYEVRVRVICPNGEPEAWLPAQAVRTSGGCDADLDVTAEVGLYVDPAGEGTILITVDDIAFPEIDDYSVRWEIGAVGMAVDGRPSYLWEGWLGGGVTNFRGGEAVQTPGNFPAGAPLDFYFSYRCPDGATGPLMGPYTLTAQEPLPCNYDLDAALESVSETEASLRLAVDTERERNSIDHRYEVEVGLAGFAPGTGAAVYAASDDLLLSQSVLLDGLSPGTEYEVYARAICPNGEAGAYTAPIAFTTAGEPVAACDTDLAFAVETNVEPNYVFVKYVLTPEAFAAAEGYRYEIAIIDAGADPDDPEGYGSAAGTLTSRYLPAGATQLPNDFTVDHYIRFTCPDGTEGEWVGYGQLTTLGGPICNEATTLVDGEWETGRINDIRAGATDITEVRDDRGAWFHFVGDGGVVQVQGVDRAGTAAKSRLFLTTLRDACDSPTRWVAATGTVQPGEVDRTYGWISTEAGRDYYVYARASGPRVTSPREDGRYRVRIVRAGVDQQNVADGGTGSLEELDAALNDGGDPAGSIGDAATAQQLRLVDLPGDDALALYPNPAKSVATLERSDASAAALVQLVDVSGQRLLDVEVAAGQAQVRLPLQGIAAGAYLLEVTDSRGRVTPARLVVR